MNDPSDVETGEIYLTDIDGEKCWVIAISTPDRGENWLCSRWQDAQSRPGVLIHYQNLRHDDTNDDAE